MSINMIVFSNIGVQMNQFIHNIPHTLLPFIIVLNNLSKNNYIVGGAVRDLCLKKVPHDYDLVTDIPMNMLVKEFSEGGFRVKETGVTHLVLNVYKHNYGVEISNFRKDVICDGRHAEVQIGTIEEDSNRRDFTVNSLYLNTSFQDPISDPTGLGLKDLENKSLRFIGNPKERIREDYLRIFRFYRFIEKGFTPNKNSLKAVRELFNEAYEKITPERVRTELEKMVL